jgi:hypothetical protein
MTPLRPQIVAAASIPPTGRASLGPMGLRGTRRQLVEIVALSLSIFGWSLLAAPADATTERPAIVPRGLEQGVLTKLNVLRRGHGLVPLLGLHCDSLRIGV